MKNSFKKIGSARKRVFSLLLALVMLLSLAAAMNVTGLAATTWEDIQVRVAKKVVVESGTPGPQTFTFDVTGVADITVSENHVTTDGANTYYTSLTIGAPELRGKTLSLVERNDGAEGWIYDTTVYTLEIGEDLSVTITKDSVRCYSVEFTNTYSKTASFQFRVIKTVTQTGTQAPGPKTFYFDLQPLGNPDADLSQITVTGSSVATNGPGTYYTTITVTGPEDDLWDCETLALTERNDGAAGWTYDSTRYVVKYDDNNTCKLYPWGYDGEGGTELYGAAFTNSYGADTVTVEVPIRKIVEYGTGREVVESTAVFEVSPVATVGGSRGVTVTNNTVLTNGSGEYEVTMQVQGSTAELEQMGNTFIVSEKANNADGWHSDSQRYVVSFEVDRNGRVTSTIMTEEDYNRGVNDPLDCIEFVNYREAVVPSQLNDDDHFAYIVGYEDGTVRPQGNMTRAEAVTVFFRLLKAEVRDGSLTDENPFTDVSKGQWFNKAVSTMTALGLATGRTATEFEPNKPITRGEFAAICARFDTTPIKNMVTFSDIKGDPDEELIKRAATLGWIGGYPDGTYRPSQFITRAEIMAIVNRVLNRNPKDKSDLLSGMTVWPDNSKESVWYYLTVQEATNSHDCTHYSIYEKWTKLTSIPDWTKYQ